MEHHRGVNNTNSAYPGNLGLEAQLENAKVSNPPKTAHCLQNGGFGLTVSSKNENKKAEVDNILRREAGERNVTLCSPVNTSDGLRITKPTNCVHQSSDQVTHTTSVKSDSQSDKVTSTSAPNQTSETTTQSTGCNWRQRQGQNKTPRIPSLIVSDTSTGDSCLVDETLDFSPTWRHSCEASSFDPNHCASTAFGPSVYQIEAGDNISTLPELVSAEHTLLSPRRSCDSAYGSSMDTGCHQDDGSTASSFGETEGSVEIEATMSSPETSPQHNPLTLSVVALRKQAASPFSSSSSATSDTPDPLLPSDDGGSSLKVGETFVRKLSSSSNCSLRSSLSFESEEDFVSGDEGAVQGTRRRHTKIKAQNSWSKIRMVIWSPFMQSFKKKYPWVQLAGHAGNFQPGEEGCILKRYVEREANCLKGMGADLTLQNFAPSFHGIVENNGEKFTQMEDLLLPFDAPSLMDCKMGIRTYLEDELIKAKVKPQLRNDMYLKMTEISPDEPTAEERELKAVTKPRYMQWREQVSSTSNLGFRIEGIKVSDQKGDKDPSKDYKLTKTKEQVVCAFKYFINNNVTVLEKYIERLMDMRVALEGSDFFHRHEVIGSSLLFVHDATGLAKVWMIDFGKTSRLPEGQTLDHRTEWVEGNREDGYLFGMDKMINIMQEILNDLRSDTNHNDVIANDVTSVSAVDTAASPSPRTARKIALKRQLAQSLSSEEPSDDVTNSKDRTS
uniref:inositol-trisphosphate 3-kinase A-like isoform X1 n=1 Tax=Ciona intestinalis TaxID=7719 RepID=UPI00089DBA48|nr:inositol-trisphosphate 3-kinase A-like isoform X1 [Ciona intestinalis]|eukprot:XP_018669260.1 inositol-trisphosphate 3-kinase A-like isoform X1 [Ciona intestinalis]